MRRVEFAAREEPLAPRAAWIPLDAVDFVLEDERLERLEGTLTPRALVLVGDGELLPWVPGVAYFGLEPGARGLYLPTHSKPQIPVALFEQLVRRSSAEGTPVLIHPAERTAVALTKLGRVDRETLRRKVERLREANA